VNAAADETLLIVVDQFEELFTLGADAAERARFAQAIVEACARDRVRVVITLRDDFLVRAGELPALRDRLAQGLTLLATPASDDLLRIVTEPARRAGYDFDDKELPGRMVRAVAGQPGALALLSFTAAQLWELRDRHFKRLTRSAYDAIGGVEGALAAHADATLAACTTEEQRLVRDAFRHLVTAEGTRAVLTRAELDDVLGRSPHAPAVIERLVGARLLVASEAAGGEDRVEIIHEALIAAWPRLVEWRRDDAEGARLRDQLRAAARQWADRGRPRGLLWRDDALDDYRRWRARWPGAVPELDEAFAAASLRDAARGRRLRRTLVVATAAVLTSATIALALLYRASDHNARTARDRLIASYVEQGRRLLLDGDYLRALPYLSAAYSAGDRSTALRFLLHRATDMADLEVAHHDQRSFLVAIAFRAGDREVISVSEDGAAAIWDATTGRELHALPPRPGVAHSDTNGVVAADGAFAVVPRGDESVVWDGAIERTFPGGERVAVDAAGAAIAVASKTEITVWDRASGAKRWSASAADTNWMIFAGEDLLAADHAGEVRLVGPGDTRTVATDVVRLDAGPSDTVLLPRGSDLAIWDGRAHQLRTFAHPIPATFALATRDGTLAVASDDSTIRLYDLADGRMIGGLPGGEGTAQRIALAGDGALLAVASNDLTLRVWDVAQRRQRLELLGAQAAYSAVAFDASGRHVVGGSADGVARLFGTTEPGATLDIDTGANVVAASFSPDDGRFAVAADRELQVRDARTGGVRARIVTPSTAEGHVDPAWTVAAIPIVLTNDVEVRDLATGAVRATLVGPAHAIWADFDRAGARVVVTYADGSVWVWSADGRRLQQYPGDGAPVLCASFSEDGQRLAWGTRLGELRLADAGAAPRSIRIGNDPVSSVGFDRGGTRVLTAALDDTVRLFRTGSLEQVTSFSYPAAILSVALSPDENLLATAAADGAVSIWEVNRGLLLTVYRHAAGAEYVTFDHAGTTLLSTGDDRHAILWTLGLETRTAEEVAAYVRCHAAYDLVDTRLVSRPAIACR
jgi:WD40 repeat protein